MLSFHVIFYYSCFCHSNKFHRWFRQFKNFSRTNGSNFVRVSMTFILQGKLHTYSDDYWKLNFIIYMQCAQMSNAKKMFGSFMRAHRSISQFNIYIFLISASFIIIIRTLHLFYRTLHFTRQSLGVLEIENLN